MKHMLLALVRMAWLPLVLFARPAGAIQTPEVDIGNDGVYDGLVKIQRDDQGRMTLRDSELTSPVTLSDLRFSNSAHWLLQGLDGDDHPQYLTGARALTWLGTRSTADVPEGSRLYFTDTRARQAVSAQSPIIYNSATGQLSIDTQTTPTFTGLALSGFAPGAIPFFTSGGKLAGNTGQLAAANGRLGTGTATPNARLTIRDGNIKFERIAAPAAAPTATSAGSGGSLGAGNYKYKISYVTATGETELGATSNIVACVANDSVNLTGIPVAADPAVISRRVYRTKLSNPNDYYLACTIADNTTSNLVDTKADAALAADRSSFVGNSTAGMIQIDSASAMRVQSSETALGIGALPPGTGFANVAVGDHAMNQYTTGYYNSALGENALRGNTSGAQNTAVGVWSMIGGPVTGFNNSALGAFSLRAATTGSNNLAAGGNALYSATGGSGNVALGANALYSVTTGGGNIAIGSAAGKNATGSNEFYLGSVEQANNANEKSYSLLYGVFSGAAGSLTGQKLAINGNVGINTTTPGAPLDVNGAARVRGGLAVDGATTAAALAVTGRPRLAPVTQVVTSSAQTIDASAGLIVVTPTLSYDMSSTPTITSGADGQLLIIINADPDHSIRLFDESSLAGSKLYLGSSERMLGHSDTITLIYSGGAWCEVAYSQNH